MTRLAYDPHTFRLVRLRSERYEKPSDVSYHPTGQPLQDCTYANDVSGNILTLGTRTPDCGIIDLLAGRDALDRSFSYDALYRLRSASGRECGPRPDDPWDDSPRPTDLTRARAYTETYSYDLVGNLSALAHANAAGNSNRVMSLTAGTNRLQSVSRDVIDFAYEHDASGNMTRETTSRHFEWDYTDRLRVFRTQVLGSEPTVYARYLYDASGQRIKKLVRKPGGIVEVTVYIDGIFERCRITRVGGLEQNDTLHVMDRARIAQLRIGNPFADDATPPVKFQLGDHLGSSNVVLDGAGNLINTEEYTPFGETSFGSFRRKRYRFGGKERDEESGLNYHDARYFAPWLCRWVSCDPAGPVDGMNLYSYVKNQPTRLADASGMDGQPAADQTNQSSKQTTPPTITVIGLAPDPSRKEAVDHPDYAKAQEVSQKLFSTDSGCERRVLVRPTPAGRAPDEHRFEAKRKNESDESQSGRSLSEAAQGLSRHFPCGDVSSRSLNVAEQLSRESGRQPDGRIRIDWKGRPQRHAGWGCLRGLVLQREARRGYRGYRRARRETRTRRGHAGS